MCRNSPRKLYRVLNWLKWKQKAIWWISIRNLCKYKLMYVHRLLLQVSRIVWLEPLHDRGREDKQTWNFNLRSLLLSDAFNLIKLHGMMWSILVGTLTIVSWVSWMELSLIKFYIFREFTMSAHIQMCSHFPLSQTEH